MNTPVSSYERQGIFDYPGTRHDGNFITDGVEVIDIPQDPFRALEAADEYLRSHGLPLIEERIPVIAYGANANPAKMVEKFDSFYTDGIALTESALHTVPCMYATLPDTDVVWHGRPGQVGGYFAELYTGSETEGTEVSSLLTFLTEEQLALLHTTEGDTYSISVIKDVDLGGGLKIDAVAYVAGEASILINDETDAPISVAGVRRKSHSENAVYTVRDALNYTLADQDVAALALAQTPDEYIETGRMLKLSEKKARQTQVQSILEANGKSRKMQHVASTNNNYGRANFVSLPRGFKGAAHESHDIELMEASLQAIRPTKEAIADRLARRKALKPNESETLQRRAVDPIEKLRFQATRSLSNPDRAKALAEMMKSKDNKSNKGSL